MKGRKLTKEDFIKQINEKFPKIIVKGEFLGLHEPIEAECTECGCVFTHNACVLKKTGCPKCNGYSTRKLSDKEYKERINEIYDGKIVPNGEYKNNRTLFKHTCVLHNYSWEGRPMSLLGGNNGCIYCKSDSYSKSMKKRHEELGHMLHIDSKKNKKDKKIIINQIDNLKNNLRDKYGNEFELLDDNYVNGNTDMLFSHNINGKTHEFHAKPYRIVSGKRWGCPVCSGMEVCRGYNDVATTNPLLASWFTNKEETYLFSQHSNKKVNFTCPNCGEVINRTVANMSKFSYFPCPCCNDGFSFPNKFIYNALKQIEDDLDFLEREFKPNWCKFDFKGKQKRGYYDIYFGINNKQYIVEMDGGLGHGNKSIGNVSVEESIYLDKQKDLLANAHNIEIIRIDCHYPVINTRYDFILSNILDSKLSDILPIEKINFVESNIASQNSIVIEACKMWEEGKTPREIYEQLQIDKGTVSSYLKQGNDMGICSYTPNEGHIRGQCRSIICVTTEEVFTTITKARDKYGRNLEISECCNGEKEYSGELEDGTKLIWLYFDDYEKMSNEVKIKLKSKSIMLNNHIICLNNLKVFNNGEKAKDWAGLKRSDSILKCCKGNGHYAGKDPITKEHLRWMYYKDYLELNNDEILEEKVG